MTVGVLNMVVTTYNMGYTLGYVIHHIGKMENRAGITPHNNLILHTIKRFGHIAFDQVMVGYLVTGEFYFGRTGKFKLFAIENTVKNRGSIKNQFTFRIKISGVGQTGQAAGHRRRFALGGETEKADSGRGYRCFRPVMQYNLCFADCSDHREVGKVKRNTEEYRLSALFIRRTVISITLFQQLIRGGNVRSGLLALIHHFPIVIQPQVIHAFKQLGNRFRRGAFQVSVFNAEQKFAIVMSGKKIVENRSTDIADMHLPRGRRCETNSYSHKNNISLKNSKVRSNR